MIPRGGLRSSIERGSPRGGCDPRSCGHSPVVDFERLYRETYPRVLAYACSVASRDNADDAVAETYAIAWRRQREIPRAAELGWLIGVTRRVLANRGAVAVARARSTRCSTSSRACRRPIPRSGSWTASCARALLALSRLDREAVLFTAWFDLSSADAAQALGITPAAFRMRAARARRRLRAAHTEITTKGRTQWNTTI